MWVWVGLTWPSMVKTGSVISSFVIGQTSDATMPASASACSAERSSCALAGLSSSASWLLSSGVAAVRSACSSLERLLANESFFAIGARTCANSTGIGGGLDGRAGLLSPPDSESAPTCERAPPGAFAVPPSAAGAASSAGAVGFSFDFDRIRLRRNGAIEPPVDTARRCAVKRRVREGGASSGRHTGLHMLNYGPVSRSADSSERTAAASRQQQRGDSRLGSNAAQRQLVLLRRRLRAGGAFLHPLARPEFGFGRPK